MTLIDEIKAGIDIVDLVGESLALRKAGPTFKAPCPFHTERTPSFIVDPRRQTWHCFGACSEGGDVFSWVMKRQGVEFREALRILADRAGIRLTPLDARAEERAKRLERLRSANETAAAFYRSHLLQEASAAAARAYLEQRGVAEEVAEAFALGYAPDQPDALLGYLSARGFVAEELTAAGLLMEAEHGHRDRLRGRLIFPIRDARGRCVGFGGRVLGGSGPKYLNTPETELFDKSGLLYGLDRAQAAARQEDRIIIVEGYMDVIAAHQHGQANVVASMGTSLTRRQVALIKPLTRNILLALDADAAGATATLRGIETAREAVGQEQVPVPDARGLVRLQDDLAADIRVIQLPEGRDPDDLIRLDPQQWASLIKEAPGYLTYRFQRAKAAHDLEDPRERAAVMEELLPLVAAISQPVVRAEYLERLAALVRLDAHTLRSRMGRPTLGSSPARPREDGTAPRPRADPQTEFLLKLAVARPEVLSEVREEALTLFQDSAAREFLQSRLSAQDEDGGPASLTPALRDYAALIEEEAAALPPFSTDQARAAARQALRRVRERQLREELHLQRHTIAEHERRYQRDPLALAAVDLERVEDSVDETEIAGAARSILESQAKGRELHAPQRSAGAEEEDKR